jgi:hypothetical protein
MKNKNNNWLFTFVCILLLFCIYYWFNFCFWYVSWISLAGPVIWLHRCISPLKHIIWEELPNLHSFDIHCQFWEHIHDSNWRMSIVHFNWEIAGYVSFAYPLKHKVIQTRRARTLKYYLSCIAQKGFYSYW